MALAREPDALAVGALMKVLDSEAVTDNYEKTSSFEAAQLLANRPAMPARRGVAHSGPFSTSILDRVRLPMGAGGRHAAAHGNRRDRSCGPGVTPSIQ